MLEEELDDEPVEELEDELVDEDELVEEEHDLQMTPNPTLPWPWSCHSPSVFHTNLVEESPSSPSFTLYVYVHEEPSLQIHSCPAPVDSPPRYALHVGSVPIWETSVSE
jgi:hypothetical protein